MNGPAPSRFPLFHPKTKPISKAATPIGPVTSLNFPKWEEFSVPSAPGRAFTSKPRKCSVSSVLRALKRGGRRTAEEAAKDQTSANATDSGSPVALRAGG